MERVQNLFSSATRTSNVDAFELNSDNVLESMESDPLYITHNETLLLDNVVSSKYKWWNVSYLLDWILAFCVLMGEVLLTNLVFHPFHRIVPENDPAFTYPLLDDTVPTYALFLLNLILVPLALGLCQVVIKSRHDFHHAMLGWFESISCTMLLTDITKLVAGRIRPDFFARAGESLAIQLDGRMSFPSGHSSISFCCLTFLALYIAGKLGLFREGGGALWKALCFLFPMSVAAWVAVSRTRDYHHHFSDVLAGSILGTSIAVMCYLLNFHSLLGEKSHLPKLHRDTTVIFTMKTHPYPNTQFTSSPV